MTTHVVIANDGAMTGPMSLYEASRYAKELRKRGNYNVYVRMLT
ncbi:hypothetical protein DFP97_112101 [Paenibacillus prosopidis]|uniref:Uncharacterized protein n=1 Tax=Paenibacillus prosopidis TaxID=630520 RepID=A0A368VRF5_9BACL|nr:hypothetical protein DFP97_112101 [Paenibacillus prosopidis]